MQIQPGVSLAHYEIVELLGKGGMGEVYRASDTRLKRDVAIKVLPEEFTKDRERLGRFEREARVLASLDHPHIASIYGIEEVDGVRFLVMQLAEGEDLARRITRAGALPVDESIEIARQIAGALDAAHEKGIVHRDLKPANVMVDDEGQVKVLDFGLAKALESEEGDEDFSDSPTIVRAATHAGVILGTAAYMSPEQARGKKVDKRADIWAFGVVLWELLTGERLFTGETVSDNLASVLKEEPNWETLPADTPGVVKGVLRLCLEKNPKNRLHDIADARVLMERETLPEDTTAGPTPIEPRSRRSIAVMAAVLMIVAALAALIGYLARGDGVPGPEEPMHLAIHLGPEQELVTEGNSLVTFSPDGRSIVFTAREEGRSALYRRVLGEREVTAIPGTEDGEGAFFSPDGAWIGFVANGRLMKVPAEGGRPFGLADARGAGGAAWNHDGSIVFAPIYSDGLFRVSADGGEPERLTTPDRDDGVLGHWWPDPLPNGKRVIFTAFRTPVDESRIGVVDLESGDVKWLVDGGFFGRYAPTGHLLYAKGQRLYALPLDPSTLETSGSAVSVLDDLRVSQTGGFAIFDVTSRGTLAYITQSLGDPASQIVWIDRDGTASPAIDERRRFISVNLSPDDRMAAVTVAEESRDLWTYAFDRGTLSRLTSGPDTEFGPVWSRDGRELYYVVDSPPFELHRIRVGSPDSGVPIWEDKTGLDTTSIAASPDGVTLAFTQTEPGTGANVYARSIDESEPATAIRATRSQEQDPTFSPDGKWIAYWSDETGRPEIYVQSLEGRGDRIQVTSDGGSEPLWADNGEIFYRRYDEMRVIATRVSDRLEVDPPRTLFSFPMVPTGVNQARSYDVTSDGSRVIAVTVPEASRPRQIEVVTNWLDELERSVPAD